MIIIQFNSIHTSCKLGFASLAKNQELKGLMPIVFKSFVASAALPPLHVRTGYPVRCGLDRYLLQVLATILLRAADGDPWTGVAFLLSDMKLTGKPAPVAFFTACRSLTTCSSDLA